MVVGTGTEQIQIQWNSHKEKEEQQSTSSSGFLLHWRHADGGDWEERELDRLSSSAQLDVILTVFLVDITSTTIKN